jgi:methylenetetrahydrofolate dehydrogenase (NADP+)/methenyltetrahydrofolate cyclohydrolase
VSARILDGRVVSAEVVASLGPRIAALARPPGLAVVLVGDDPASAVYVRNKARMAERLGYVRRQVLLPVSTTEAELLAHVDALNTDPAIDGVLVQLPLPAHIDRNRVLDRIAVDKDVDGFHPTNVGLLSQNRPCLAACTPVGVMELLARTGERVAGKDAVVVGRSNIVGRPMVQLLDQADLTVTMCHRRTQDLGAHVRRADVLVVAVGIAGLVRGEWVKPGAIVIDVGINRRADGSLCGDVAFEAAAERASWITPVPGGVGPMTIAMLMKNTLVASERRQGVVAA